MDQMIWVGTIAGIALYLQAKKILNYLIDSKESILQNNSSLCKHGVEWDECPDCCH
jgi:hypothetical protein